METQKRDEKMMRKMTMKGDEKMMKRVTMTRKIMICQRGMMSGKAGGWGFRQNSFDKEM